MPVFGTQMFGSAAAKTAVAYSVTDTSGSTANASSFTFTSQAFGAEDSSRVIVIATAGSFNNKAGAVSGITIGGVTGTEIVAVNSTSGDGTAAAIYAAAVPTGTTGTVVVTLSVTTGASSRGFGIGVYRLTGPGTLAANDTNTDTGTGNRTNTLSVNTEDGGAVIATGGGTSTLGSETYTGVTEDGAGGKKYSHGGIATTSDESPRTVTVATVDYVVNSFVSASWVPA